MANVCGISEVSPKDMPSEQIREEISDLLYDFPNRCSEAKDPELLTITIKQNKANKFDFLKADTNFRTVGTWEGETEPNVSREVQFKDTPDERIGRRLKDLLEAYNDKEVKEELLYFRTVPVEETSL